jgi:UPF0176 protein
VEPKVLLYYHFTPLEDPEAIRLWQWSLCEQLNLKGRILISRHGINGTVGGELKDVKRYIKVTRSYPGFKNMEFKWSEGTGNDFPRLRVRVRDEIVAFGTPDELKVDENGVIGGGVHLKPQQVNDLVAERGDDVVFFDGRNHYEAKIGRFKNAIVPDTRTTHDFVTELESGKYDHLKKKPIITYCTGGVRCEILSVLMKNRGFEEVYQIDGGVVRYGERFGNQGLWEGSLYIFDNRMNHEFGADTAVIGECDRCGGATSTFHNCADVTCHKLILLCDTCAHDEIANSCTPEHKMLMGSKVE